MEIYTLPRTGDRPVRFTGEILAQVSTREHQGPCENRWWVLTLYRTGVGQYVAAIGYHTQWQGELGRYDAYRCEDAQAVTAALRGHDYLGQVSRLSAGYGEREISREQQRLRKLSRCWEAGITDILFEIEPEEL